MTATATRRIARPALMLATAALALAGVAAMTATSHGRTDGARRAQGPAGVVVALSAPDIRSK